MYLVKEIADESKKSEVTNYILRELPEWFGIEKSIVEYVENVKDRDFFAVYDNESPVGFVCLKYNNAYTAEVYVMGILKEYHKKGIGKQLILKCEEKAKLNNIKYLMVKTLGESHSDENYKKTRLFYNKVGFYPLEEIKEIWGKENPCLIMVKNI